MPVYLAVGEHYGEELGHDSVAPMEGDLPEVRQHAVLLMLLLGLAGQ